MLWQQGLLLKLNRLKCPIPYLLWITNYFKDRSMIIDLNGLLSDDITVARGAPQGSVFGAIAYTVAHHDLLQIFERSENNHLYVDDLGSIYVPNIYCNYKNQRINIEQRMNKDLQKLHEYANQWHQPINSKKTQYVVFTNIVNYPKLRINYEGSPLEPIKIFKYLGYQLDAKMTFKPLVDAQLEKYHQAYHIIKYIHRQFPSFYKLKSRFFTIYIWAHLSALASIYCLLSDSLKERINSFHRRCLRIIYHLFQCSTIDLHTKFSLPTLEEKFKKSLARRLHNIEQHEQELIACYLMNKSIINTTRHYYTEKSCIPSLPRGRPSTRIIRFYQNTTTYFDKLLQFSLYHTYNQSAQTTTIITPALQP